MGVDGLSPGEEEALERLVGHRAMAWTGFIIGSIVLLVFLMLAGLGYLSLAGIPLTLGLFAYGATDVAEFRIRMIAHLRVARAPLRPTLPTPTGSKKSCGQCGNHIPDASTFCERCGVTVV